MLKVGTVNNVLLQKTFICTLDGVGFFTAPFKHEIIEKLLIILVIQLLANEQHSYFIFILSSYHISNKYSHSRIGFIDENH